MARRWCGVLLFGTAVGVFALGQAGAPALPQGLIPVPAEPGIQVSLETTKATYAPGDALRLTFTLSREAYVYLYNLTANGEVKLLVPNRFLQDPRFAAGKHTLPTAGWVLRVTEPEGIEYLQLVATDRPLSFYEAKEFEKSAFLGFANPAAFAQGLWGSLRGEWGTSWTQFRIHRPRATLDVTTTPAGAEVWVGGIYAGASPLSTVIAPGRIRVRIEKDGYEAKAVDLTVADGEEVTLAVVLSRARPAFFTPPTGSAEGELPPLGIGLAAGLRSFSLAAELWLDRAGLGVSLQPQPPLPDLTAPGSGGWSAWSPEVEGYIAAWLPVGRAGALALLGLSFQEMVWIPFWAPSGVLVPLLEVEPETRTQVRLTAAVGGGASGLEWRAYLLWHTRRGLVLGVTLTP